MFPEQIMQKFRLDEFLFRSLPRCEAIKIFRGVGIRNMCVKSSLIKRMEFSIQYSSDNNKCLQIAYGNAKRFNGRWMN